jgi:site-specific DNA-methyltransferase (adenine-specific)
MLTAPLRNTFNCMDGRDLLAALPAGSVPLVIFDPQYRAVLDKLKFGNEGARQIGRHGLPAMSDAVICEFTQAIGRVLKPSGHLGMWVDKFTLGTARHLQWSTPSSKLQLVDFIAWDKGRIGMGRRSRSRVEYLLIIQKAPIRAKGCWHTHRLPDCWYEYADRQAHPHAKPLVLQQEIIKATTKRGDLIVDPAAGGYSTMLAAKVCGCEFLGCDLATPQEALS